MQFFSQSNSNYVFLLNIFRNLIQVNFSDSTCFRNQNQQIFSNSIIDKDFKKKENRREVFKQNRCENIQILFSILDSTKLVFNVLQLGEVAEIEAQMFSFAQKFNRRTAVEFSTKPAILPNCCYLLCCFLSVITPFSLTVQLIVFSVPSRTF